ncbi:MAG: PRD domain-containing protein [Lachnospiraceae bacterium]|nr:PRD domain-containing protein [Lachnospiraceae bacterium]
MVVRILKILNNNLVLSKDQQGREVIVKGCGIAFQKKRGQEVEEEKIEKIFIAETPQKSKQIQNYLTSIPEQYFDFVAGFVDEMRAEYGLELNESIYFALSDHIYGTIQRLNRGISLKNMLLMDIKQLYRREYDIGVKMLKAVQEELGQELPLDEVGFIALHFVNAQDENGTDVEEISKIVKKIRRIVSKYYAPMVFQEDNLYYQRFLTHLKYFAQRFLHKKLQYDEDTSLYEMVRKQYKEAYGCVKLIYLMMEEDYQYQMTEEEMLYLIIHIQKVAEDHKEIQ